MKAHNAPSLLGLLSLKPMSGYDMKKFVGESIGHFWNESYGQIYPMLKRLARQGLVESRVVRGKGKPDRKVFSLAPKGRKLLRSWLAAAPRFAPPRNELLLKLFFGRLCGRADMIRHVREFRQHHAQLLVEYAQVEKWICKTHPKHPDKPYWLITLGYGRDHSKGMLKWSDQTLKTLARLPNGGRRTKANRKKGAVR
jgi:DNA-binding PadR family transcriptional regulator